MASPPGRLAPDRDHLRLVIAGGIFAVFAGLFALLAVVVARRCGPLGPDARVLQDVVDWRSDSLTTLARALTKLGTDVVVYPLLIMGALLCWRRTGRILPGLLAIAVFVAGQLVRVGINHTIARPRPPAALRLVGAGGYSFPSGHTSNATMAYGLLAFLLTLTVARGRWAFIAGAAIVAIAVGLSRIYLAVHWATDVAGGWLFGLSWLTLGALLVGVSRRRPQAAIRSSAS
ncbi:MAG TPA: phosphatase PAP2 family protein [Frankiaceae bacterium]|jgi:undecaprenyl-diphosphatase|nr:phosphatase PAP2 family protein [Frankiaceae bacterium]